MKVLLPYFLKKLKNYLTELFNSIVYIQKLLLETYILVTHKGDT